MYRIDEMNSSKGNQNSNQIEFFSSNRDKHFYCGFVFNKSKNRNNLYYSVREKRLITINAEIQK